MLNINKVKGIIFDYGATIDSNGKHWAEVLWDAYIDNQILVDKQAFRDAYVYGERFLALNPVIKPDYTFKDVLSAKTELQINWLIDNGFLLQKENKTSTYSFAVSNQCYNFVCSTIKKAKPVLQQLSKKYPLVLVSNFYGNIEAVLEEFGIATCFVDIIESAVVGLRKPDPAIFALGVEALRFQAEEVVVIGDSHKKDIAPAGSIGCQTIWIKGPAWEEEKADLTANEIIYDFAELKNIFQLH